ncbi:MAG: hypothetical protein HY822_17715 [Acidobacteria bacterium]|nr:hypothetical protein [Acidobacteriota bacterium]
MTAEEGAAFEAHYFECGDCAADVKTTSHFVANAQAWFETQRAPARRNAAAASPGSALWGWFRPVWLSPALATVFAVLAGYSWLVTIPGLRQERAASGAVEVFQPVVLRAQLRGEEAPVVRVAPGSPAVITLNIESDREYPGYEIEILNASGATISKVAAPGWPTINLRLPPALSGNGTHTVIVRGGSDEHPEIGRYRFQLVREPK